LGTYWHGGIPTGGRLNTDAASAGHFQSLIRRFYPHTDIFDWLGKPWLFQPWQPVRPKAEWQRLKAERSDRLEMLHETVSRVAIETGAVSVHTASSTYRGKRVWLCAGALHTPALLDGSLDTPVSRPFVSDHVFCYLGRIDRSSTPVPAPSVRKTRDGLWFPRRYDTDDRALYMMRPARFAFSRLDNAIERRSAYGRPTGNDMLNVMRSFSSGLFAEALYNRTGLFPGARMQSVYALITVPDAHSFNSREARISIRDDAVQTFVDDVRATPPWQGMELSKRPDISIPSTHLYHSVDVAALTRAGVNEPTSRVQVADASALEYIGPDHHTFK
jgi:hypothetical protein